MNITYNKVRNVTTRALIKAYRYVNDDFGISSVGGLILGLGDVTWLINDISHNGFRIAYFFIGVCFIVGTALLVYGLHRHKRMLKREITQNKKERALKEQLILEEEQQMLDDIHIGDKQ